ncbi:hypothetical protein KI387_035422, partial [Taxus chinensis]
AGSKEEETYDKKLGCTYLEKEKGKLVYMIDDEEIENLDVDHIVLTCEVLDNADEIVCTYHEPMKMNNVNIGIDTKPKE